MIRITLGEADRARYGLDGPLSYDVAALTAREAGLVQTAGYERVEDWLRCLDGRPVITGGRYEYQTDPQTGAQVLDADGLPVPRTVPDYGSWRVLVWLALRRDGRPDLALDDVDYAVTGLRWDIDEAGKAPSPTPSTSTPQT